ncbi:MAG TPA: 50S ribosomal protein L30 [Candidatus Kapabacteria bacterium]|nr:50S ribosomal protein L30 [Candidatus Kapabacteria bacterium]
MAKIKVTQIRSMIDYDERQKRTIRALGLGRPGYFKVHEDTPQVLGMITKVRHMLKVEPVSAKSAK